ncbi:MAG: hypothetical protein MUC85_07000, partial [Anaerolineales bacterium]|nr:hypothetical protein [Anaerolineales bacterium]
MTEKKKTLLDHGIDLVRELLGPKPAPASSEPAKKIRLQDLPLDDLKYELVRLEQDERKTLANLREIEEKKKQLFAAAVNSGSDREKLSYARKIKQLDLEAASLDKELQMNSRQQRAVNGLYLLKKRTDKTSESGLNTILSQIDMGELLRYIDNASTDGEFSMNKFDEILRGLEDAEQVSPEFREDKDVMDIFNA